MANGVAIKWPRRELYKLQSLRKFSAVSDYANEPLESPVPWRNGVYLVPQPLVPFVCVGAPVEWVYHIIWAGVIFY